MSAYHAQKANTQHKIVKLYHEANGTPGYSMMHDLLEKRTSPIYSWKMEVSAITAPYLIYMFVL